MFLGSVLQMPRVLLSKKILLVLLSARQKHFFVSRMSEFRVMGKGDKPNTKLE